MIITNCNVNKLHSEFIVQGIRPFPVFELENGDGDFAFPESTDMTLVQQIIEAHDSTPLPQPLGDIEQLRLEQAQANAELFEMMLMLTGGGV